MCGISKIRKFFDSNDIACKFVKSVICDHYGGRGFYNDGKYTENIYEVKIKESTYFMKVKSSGRAHYRLDSNKYHSDHLVVHFNQRDFITSLEHFIEKLNEKKTNKKDLF